MIEAEKVAVWLLMIERLVGLDVMLDPTTTWAPFEVTEPAGFDTVTV